MKNHGKREEEEGQFRRAGNQYLLLFIFKEQLLIGKKISSNPLVPSVKIIFSNDKDRDILD